MMNKQRTTARLWSRTTKALGKFFSEMVLSSGRHLDAATRGDIYPRFPIF
jgi:hypothetical protein